MSMGFEVVKAGMLTTIQDLGRFGYQKSGIIIGGAMDKLALRIGNLLLGNSEDEPGLEITLVGPTLRFKHEQLIVVTGADLSPSLNGNPIVMWRPTYVPSGAILSFGRSLSGCRAYLSVAGGFNIKPELGSCATYLQAGIGGWQGRALKNGDEIPFNKKYEDRGKFTWLPDLKLYPPADMHTVRVVAGPELSWFTKESTDEFFKGTFIVSKENNRMGYRLDGPELQLLDYNMEMLSSPVCSGTVQVPQKGKPIILMADCQTAGGYPRIANIISADMSILAQKQTGDQLKFELVTLAQAHKYLLHQERQLRQLKQTLSLKYG